ncbi:H-type small acid-soluble spore protein [Chengkuizengella axinellae]|uniref:H-type small acid-soluble spore protein n=1 Tax=Chengkuizengella axinellae TaxID=3064388 RepID=A0ABT9J5A1_9BACL|nr:H-type small acid-soluble spore protein [Chengkuizengella sp. 2205SS18-9]MDP5276658.1 H-type small acid-soluble spore protein [Chengkuizengella sp. 2205SS18-9]
MDVERAQEIFDSKAKINVYLNGKEIWIDKVDPVKRSVNVHEINNPNEQDTVTVDKLKELQ